jgi:hypothetical protein
MMRILLNRLWLALLALVFVAGCGGGGGGGGGTAPAPVANTASFSMGAISGFGSVVVNGVHWSDDASVDITLDDAKGDTSDLRVGMVVEVEGDDHGDGTGTAHKISFENLVRGPVESVDVAGNSLVVLGQTVKVSGATVFDDPTGTVTDLTGIAPGDIVAVSGWFDNVDPTQTNNIVARRIEKEPVPFNGELKVKGFVKSTDATAKTFKINALTVDFSTAQITNNGASATVTDGLFVDVRTHTLPTPLGGTLVAETIKVKDVKPAPAEGAQVEVEGIITDLDPVAMTFKVGGIPVDASAVGVAGLANGMKVEVKGTFTNGVLVLSANEAEVERELEPNVKIQALVQAVDSTANTITLLGKTVKVTAQTQLRDKAQDKHTFSFADLLVGDAVQVRAFVDTNGDIVAVKLERVQKPLANDILQGPMDTMDPATTSLTIIGIKVLGGAQTVWRLANHQTTDAATWFASTAVNTIVKAQGVEGSDGKSLDATAGQVQVQVGDD